MKLKRKWSWLCIVGMTVTLLFLLLLGITGRVEFCVLSILGILAMWLIRLCCLRCPNCGEGVGPVRWNPGKRYYCSICGKPFVFDDEPDDP